MTPSREIRRLGLCLGLLALPAACQRPAKPLSSGPTAEEAPAQQESKPPASSPTPTQADAAWGDAKPHAAKALPPWPPTLPPRAETDWCIESVFALDEETCLVMPERRSERLLIYLHGIVPPTKESVQKTNFEKVVARASRRANVVALIPRGEQGFAPKGYAGWWSWPTSSFTFRKKGAPFVAKLKAKREKLEKLVGYRFKSAYVAGSSAGAYFVVALALHGVLEVDGFGAMSGGTGYETEGMKELSPKPFYIGFGKHDSVAGSARDLGRRMEKLGWPVLVRAHATGHGAREVYLDEAFPFWLKGRAPGSAEKSRSD